MVSQEQMSSPTFLQELYNQILALLARENQLGGVNFVGKSNLRILNSVDHSHITLDISLLKKKAKLKVPIKVTHPNQKQINVSLIGEVQTTKNIFLKIFPLYP